MCILSFLLNCTLRVTTVKDKETHKSTGVAFVLFLERESAHKCVKALNRRTLFGRTLKCSIAKDNGRTTEFIRRKFYTDKSRCYECGVSYNNITLIFFQS